MAERQSETRKQDGDGAQERVGIEQAAPAAGEPGGRVSMSEHVVETIAGYAARQIAGIHELGKSRFVKGGKPARGVAAEVGAEQTAIDLDVTIEYGCDIRQTAAALREAVAREVNHMAGREVVEVNVNVRDIHMPETKAPAPSSGSRVR